MSGDFSRDTFRPGGNRTFVRMQQGRLLTDADWNEQGDILSEAHRETAADVIGQSGFPEDEPGFALVAAGAGNGIAIMPGEAYVDGIRVASPAMRLALSRSSGAGAATKWQLERGSRVLVGDLVNLAGQPPVRVSQLFPDSGGKQIFQCAAALSANNNIEVQRAHGVDSQPYLAPPQLPTQPGDYVAYLDVWERPIGAIEDPLIRETAFGGPDTAMRDQLVWQVRFARQADLVAAGALVLPATCKSFGPGWTPLGTATAPGAMAARAEAASAATNPCVLPSTGGYRSLENRLYRVEVHNGGRTADNVVSVKWSRDNGIHRTAYGQIDNGAILVDTLGRDDSSALRKNDWVEITDEARRLAGTPGFFGQVKDINGNRVSLSQLLDPDTLQPLVANNLPNMAVLPAQGQLRRWEGGPPQKVAPNSWIKLENGVEVQFAAGRYSTQDYWTIPARTVTAGIEWPRDPAVAGAPAFVPAMGVRHHYCVLAIANLGGGGAWQLTDCRSLFAPLTRQRGFHYLGGDGQEAMPNPLSPATRIALGAPLRAGLVRGRTPVQGASVRFTIVSGGGQFGNGATVQVVQTGADGVAAVNWSVGAAAPIQQARAELLDSANQPTHLPIVFTANLSTAAATSFDPAKVPALAGENTVQGAIEKLAGMQQVGCATRVVVEGSDWVSVLKGLKPKEDATVCFQRGTYETQDTVLLADLGHVTLSGAGAGTRIVGKRRECAIEFRNCASVTVHDLDISCPDGTAAIDNLKRNGSLTISECGAADVHDCTLSCGAGVAAERTCLTIQGKGGAPIPSVRVQRNRIAAGYGQDGILVTDCIRGVIDDNELLVLPRPHSLSAGKLLAGREWRTRLVELLVRNPQSEAFHSREDDKQIRGGQWVVGFDSPVSQAEWNKLMEADPPKAEDLKSEKAFVDYAERIFDLAMTEQNMPPSHKKRIGGLTKRTGRGAFDALDRDFKRELLVQGEVRVGRFDEKAGRAGAIILSAQGQRILFDSPVGQADWNKAMKAMAPEAVAQGDDLIAHARAIAVRILSDEAFRGQLGTAVAWYKAYVQNLPTYGRQAITCGGRVLANVTVSGNRTDGFTRGVHIGTSFARDPRLAAGIVTVRDNNLFLRLPGEDVYAGCGLFVGNAETIRIERNTLAWSNIRGSSKTAFAQGIRVWGYLGPFLAIVGNRIDTAPLGIRVKVSESVTGAKQAKLMWVASDNLVPNAGQGLTLRVPHFMERRNNKPA